MTAAEQTNTALSAEEMDQFRTQGFLGPFALCSPKEMGATRPAVEAVLESEPPDHSQKVHNRHLDQTDLGPGN